MGRSRKKGKPKLSNKPKEIDEKKMELAVSNHVIEQEVKQMEVLCKILKDNDCREEIMLSLATLSSFVLEEKGASLLLNCNGLVYVVSNLLNVDHGIREKALGTLTNLVVTCGDEIAEIFLNNQVLVKVTMIFKEAFKTLNENYESFSVDGQEKEVDFLVNCFQLLNNLCEMSSAVVNSLDLEFYLPFVLLVIKSTCVPQILRIKAALSVYIISEDNNILAGLILAYAPNFVEELIQNKESDLLKMLCNGIIFNLLNTIPLEKTENVISAILHDISICLQSVNLSSIDFNNLSEVEMMLAKLESQQIGLELLSNILCYESGESEEWVEDDNDDNDGDNVHCQMLDEKPSSNYLDVIKELNILTKVVEKCHMNVNNHSSNEKWNKSIRIISSRAWQCMSNILSNASNDTVNTMELSQLWSAALKNIQNDQGHINENCDGDLFDAISSAIRAIAHQLFTRGEGQNLSTLEVIELLGKLLQIKSADSSKMNLISILSMIGKDESQNKSESNVLKAIGEVFSLMLCSATPSPLVVAELLDATFDSFADGPCVDKILIETYLLQALKKIQIALKTMTKEEKRTLGANLGVINMAKSNLNRFLKYKENVR